MPSGKIALINHQYVILNDKKMIIFTPLLCILLPGDTVEYKIKEDKIVIQRLKERTEQYFPGIVNKLENGLSYFFSNGYPKYFSPFTPNPELKIGDIVILKATMNGIECHKVYGQVTNRLIDKILIEDLYLLNRYVDVLPSYDIKHYSLYTKPYTDLSHLDTFHMDPEESKDFDDAISVEEEKRIIYVHITDIHRHIDVNSDLDIEAFRSSFTLYLPEKVTNIFPPSLSEDKMSLVKDTKKNVITIEYHLSEKNNILSYDIYPSLIHIKKRYFYHSPPISSLLESFVTKWKVKSYNIPQLKLKIDDITGKISSYYREINTDLGHKMIETLMVLTNMTISRHILENVQEPPQRFHKKSLSIEEKEQEEYKENKEYKDNNDNKDNKESHIQSIIKIKKFRSAIYSKTERGHFGLRINTYTHFTSPIRRYFDIIIHRMIHGYELKEIDNVLNYLNEREKNIDQWIKLYNNLKILDFFSNNKERVWEGYIISKTEKGCIVMIYDFLYEVFCFKNDWEIGEKVNVRVNDINWLTLSVKIIVN